jgi:tRNA threonylcarbamoyladenosine biosynthesis protein TsaB
MQLVGKECVSAPEKVMLAAGMLVPDGAGTGWQYAERLAVRVGRNWPQMLPDARDLLDLALPRWEAGAVLDAADAQPVYLRDKVASPRQSG